MTTHHGKEGVMKIGAAAFVEIKNWSIEETAKVAADNAQGDDWDTHLVGRNAWSVTGTANFDSADTTTQALLRAGAQVTGNFYPYGTATTAKYLTGAFTVTRRGVDVPEEGAITVAFTGQGNGALTDQVVGA